MEAFTTDDNVVPEEERDTWDPGDHISVDDVKVQMHSICSDKSITDSGRHNAVGDCAHGIGHALMFLTNYDIDAAMELCGGYESHPMQYYCATGGYMEYAERAYDRGDMTSVFDFSPCPGSPYPAACFRYQGLYVMQENYKAGGTLGDLVDACEAFSEIDDRLGCFHGIGHGHTDIVAAGLISVGEVCSFGTEDDMYVCTEGLMERLARIHPDIALEQCYALENGWQRDLCFLSVERELYDLEKPFDLYLR